MFNELTGFLTSQIPVNGSGLIALFLWMSVGEPIRARILRNYPPVSAVMVGLGYAELLFVLTSAQYADDSDSLYVAAATITFLVSLWLIVSGLFSAIISAPRMLLEVRKLKRAKTQQQFSRRMVTLFVASMFLLVVYALMEPASGPISLIRLVCLSLAVGLAMMSITLMITVPLGAIVVYLNKRRKATVRQVRQSQWWPYRTR